MGTNEEIEDLKEWESTLEERENALLIRERELDEREKHLEETRRALDGETNSIPDSTPDIISDSAPEITPDSSPDGSTLADELNLPDSMEQEVAAPANPQDDISAATTMQPEDQPKEKMCELCGAKLAYVEQYHRWYCYACKMYA